ncbi:hypothetical protein KYK29_11365 [Shinella daejeonensis]|uniref:hypothetical protein n=1 Tax=Shinella daejeonensis TaxID=659017 RepID=UPI0020C79368|nr:hypothetical protein [Shinella daejeonensis]MCP8895523.1 hypothetical protein [Shinella daejeonensis]
MRQIGNLLLLAGALMLAGCVASTSSPVLEPIPGSITYNGQPRTKLTKSPVGSTFEHRFTAPVGREYVERYRIRPDRSLEIISRRRIDIIPGFYR